MILEEGIIEVIIYTILSVFIFMISLVMNLMVGTAVIIIIYVHGNLLEVSTKFASKG